MLAQTLLLTALAGSCPNSDPESSEPLLLFELLTAFKACSLWGPCIYSKALGLVDGAPWLALILNVSRQSFPHQLISWVFSSVKNNINHSWESQGEKS